MSVNQNLLNLGQTLKERREDQGLSLKEVSEKTKISLYILQAIEEANANQLPVYTYLRGFIITYANILGLDKKQVLAEVDQLRPKKEDWVFSHKTASYASDTDLEKEIRLGPIILAIVILFVLGGTLVISNVLRSYNSSKKIICKEGDQECLLLQEEVSINQQALIKEKDLEESIKNQDDDDTDLKEPSLIKVNTAPALKKSKAKSTNKILSFEVIAKALAEVEISFQVDKEKEQTIVLQKDQFKLLRAKNKVVVKTKNSDLIYIFYNGKNLGIFGLGEPKEQVFLKENL